MNPQQTPIVRLVDDDEHLLKAQSTFLRMANLEVKTYSSAMQFLEEDDLSIPGCLILDVRMPRMSGIELQAEMKRRNLDLPIIFLSAHGDIEMAVEAVQRGAKTFLTKPPSLEKLISVIEESIAENVAHKKLESEYHELENIWGKLTPAEQQVAEMVAKGLTTTVIGTALECSERTVRARKSEIYFKLDVENATELSQFIHYLEDARKIFKKARRVE